MTEETRSIVHLTDEDLQALLQRAIRNTLILGLLAALAIMIATSWRDGAMMATGGLISAASLSEWQRMSRLINSRIKKQKAPRSAVLVIGFFLVRLIVFAAAIYGSLKCFQGSFMALICGLSLAVATLMWEALRLFRD